MKLNQFQKDVQKGACIFCGNFTHSIYDKMTNEDLKALQVELSELSVVDAITKFGDQQGALKEHGCIQYVLNKRK